MPSGLIFTRPDEDWVRTATLSATSEQVGYEAAQAATDEPSEPWWADSSTATLTVTLSGSQEVGMIALIATNADAGNVITIAGGITGGPTMTGARYPSGYPKDLVYVVDPPQTLSAVTFAIAGNSSKWSVGRVVIGKRRSLGRTFYVGAYTPTIARIQVEDESDLGHELRYDFGVEMRGVAGSLDLVHDTDLATLDDWWSSTKAGFLPTLVLPNYAHVARYPPMFARFKTALPKSYNAPNMARVSLAFTEVQKGIEVVG